MRWLALAAVVFAGCNNPYVVPLPKEAVHFRARTQDGWELSLVRYRPDAPSGRPVLLVHGISANARNMDLDVQHSLARWFAAHGREAWTLSLRGTGLSDRADPKHGRLAGYALDAFWQYDLPAAIAKVREVSGADAVDYVAHSMGGMVGYAYLSQGGEGIHAAVMLGSPVRLDFGGPYDPFLTSTAELVQAGWTLPARTQPFVVVPASGVVHVSPLEPLLYNPKNVNLDTWRKLMASGTADVSGGVAKQLAILIRDGRFTNMDGRRDFLEDLAKVRTPVMIVAGKSDRLGIPAGVKPAYRKLGGPKEWLLVGEETGAKADYCHMDLVIGDRAAEELWPRLLDFLNRHS